MMSDETLRPCPFCGGEAFVNDDPTGNGGKPHMNGNVGLGRLWSVECDECGADAGFWQDRNVAIAAWNTRATHGTLTAGQVREAIEENSWAETSTIREFNDSSWQAIADELNARAERTCRDANTRFNAWTCSECKCTLLLVFDDYGEPTLNVDGVASVPNYCPNCGRKVTA